MIKKGFIFAAVFLALIRIPASDEDLWTASLEKIQSMAAIVEAGYYKDLDVEKLAYASIRGLLETLDPHSYFLEPDNLLRMREDYVGKYFGVGMQIQKQGDRLVVVAPMEGTPAWRLGIQPGDVISHINGESTKPISSWDALQKLRGEKGTTVHITIVRDGLDKPIDLTVTREEIPLYSVPYAFMLDNGVGYIYIRNFAENTDEELREKLERLKGEGMKSLILDLRGNPGGPLVSSIEVSDEFLPKGVRVVSIRGRNPAYNKDFYAFKDNQYEKMPLVILIDQGTASASEIVSGAVMDNDRGLVVGHDSWGKGLVQTVFPLSQKEAVAITTAKYLTPSGRSIQRDYSHIEDYMMAKQVPNENREIKYTNKGRKVLGQGGITPDYEAGVPLKPLSLELFYRGAYFSYARKFAQHQTELSKKFIFPQDPSGRDEPGKIVIGNVFPVSPEVLEDFKEYLRSISVRFDEAKFKEAEGEIRRELEREITSALWGVEEGTKVYRKSDPVVAKALEVMPEAARLVE
jgi:carboxyl-terminal processing protease